MGRVYRIPRLLRCSRKPSQSSTSIAKWYGDIRSIDSTGVKCRSKFPRVIRTTLVLLFGVIALSPKTSVYHFLVRSGSVVGKFTWWL